MRTTFVYQLIWPCRIGKYEYKPHAQHMDSVVQACLKCKLQEMQATKTHIFAQLPPDCSDVRTLGDSNVQTAVRTPERPNSRTLALL